MTANFKITLIVLGVPLLICGAACIRCDKAGGRRPHRRRREKYCTSLL